MKKKIIFVYNAKSDIFSKYIDLVHKIISPSTYACGLCSLTHGNFSEKEEWRIFRENTDHEFVFMYKNDFLETYPNLDEYSFPVIFEENKKKLELIFDSEKLTTLKSVESLVEELSREVG
ncbi:GTPase [Aquimarina sp. AD10]|uniref:GTPase n=1 Tax=Aquimarina aggregata TaxID=1642818 RepID=A0A162YDE4_9FLAO|nr:MULTISPECIES: hypothetical protein [Aquimarina]AXT60960.1 GTPase [Aquimarina sp. AD10]KZS39063.1 hypothetical protein AWE51_10900 [Aquimarina aggregata]RKM95602.1 GTPase [Aquimarina sp. AD10]